MAVGDEYLHAALTRAHLVDEALGWGLDDPRPVIDQTLTTVLDAANTEMPDERASIHLADDIRRFSENLLSDRAVNTR